MIRKELNWEEYWRFENEEERIAAIYYNADKKPTGVLFYWISDEVFHIKEMFYLNQEARNGLWNFISAHFSMVYWVKGDIFKNEPSPSYWMTAKSPRQLLLLYGADR